jgi:hypothetical protein
METVTVYKDSYYDEMDRAFALSTELAFVKGTIKALAGMEDSPEFVFAKLKEMAENFEKGVDISAG